MTKANSPFAAIDFGDTEISATNAAAVEGPFIDDGTLVKPIAVDTTVPDGSGLVQKYKVKKGDKLGDIATQFKVSPMTIVWANNLKSKTDFKKGDTLRIPPVTGLIVKVAATDTLATIASSYGVDGTDILVTNGIDDPNLVVGQVLVLPGAKGKAIPKPSIKPSNRLHQSSGGGGGDVISGGPKTYTGGKFMFPVVGGDNYISQYFHYGHYAIDIAADYGTTVRCRSRRHGDLRRLEEQRRRLPGLGGARLRAVHDLQPHVGDLGRARPARRTWPAGRSRRPVRQRERPASPLRGLARPRLGRRPAREPARIPVEHFVRPPGRPDRDAARSVREWPRCSSTA